MERRHLTYFLAVADSGSISAAARRLHLAQPSVSQGVRELERELRTPLLTRGRTAALTPAGRALIGPARRALRAFDEVRDAVGMIDELATGILDIAVAPQLAVDPAVPLVASFRERYPGVRVRVHEADPGVEGFEVLRRAEAELLVHGHPAPYPKHRAVRLRCAENFVVLPPGTDGLPEGPMPLEELVCRPLVLGLAGDSAVRVWFAAELAAHELPPVQAVVEIAHRDAIVPLVLAGAGAALLTEPEARAAAKLGAVIRPLAVSVPQTCHLFHRGGLLSPAAQAFVEMAAEQNQAD
ncbi:LysR family transcriptional regulator [Streptomyces sp. NPDC051453]|uniref:LysR family transcriptional regulator n=1 Tax=Streptomyces sp. NPDC051453 TaxID=3154941 RepID=UPI003444D8F3